MTVGAVPSGEVPKPGRSGAMTVACAATRGVSALQLNHASSRPPPCSNTAGGPVPVVSERTGVPLTSMVGIAAPQAVRLVDATDVWVTSPLWPAATFAG